MSQTVYPENAGFEAVDAPRRISFFMSQGGSQPECVLSSARAWRSGAFPGARQDDYGGGAQIREATRRFV